MRTLRLVLLRLVLPLLFLTWFASAGPIVPGTPWTGGNGTSGQVLTSNGANNLPSFQAGGGGGSGTVTSVAFADASSTSIYVITGSPVTTSGTLTQTLATESPNFVLAGPASGVTAVQPTFRALNAADVTAALVSPPPIGATTASTGAFTTLSASSTVSGTGFSTYLASPPAIGGTAPAAISATTLSASSTVSGTGFSTYLASPPAIGGTAPSTVTASPLLLSGNITSSTGNANGYGMGSAASTPNYTDSSAAGGTVAAAYLYSFPAANLETTTTTTYTNVGLLNLPAPTCSTGGGGTPTCTNKYSLVSQGNARFLGTVTVLSTFSPTSGITVTGGPANLNASSNNATNINTGTSTGTITIGNSGTTGATVLAGLASSSAAQTGTVCIGTGNVLSYDTTTTCLLSDGRLKMNVEPLDAGLADVMQLKPVSYDLKPETNPTHLGKQVGLIAQDVIKVDPRLAAVYQSGPQKGTPSGVRYEQLTAVLVKAIQEQQVQIATLQARLERLEHARP
jgi:Chaperone of endosialidase